MKIDTAKQLFLMNRSASGLVEKSLHEYKATIERFIQTTKITDTSEVTKYLVLEWITDRQSEYMKANTINSYLQNLRVFFYWLMEEDLCPKFRIKLIKASEEPLKLYTDDELKKLLEKPKTDNFIEWRTYTMICFALGTGARISTIVNIEVEDINFLSNMVTYKHNKNRYTACVPITPTLAFALRKYMAMFDITTGWLFPSSFGGPLNSDSSLESLIDYNRKRGVDRHSWHSFRHNFARQWVISGGDLFKLQIMLQHQTLSQTQHYAKIFSEDLKDTSQFTALETLQQKNKKHIH